MKAQELNNLNTLVANCTLSPKRLQLEKLCAEQALVDLFNQLSRDELTPEDYASHVKATRSKFYTLLRKHQRKE